MKRVLWVICFFIGTESFAGFRIVHYNLKELDTVKLKQGMKNEQVRAAIKILKKLKPDFISLNEVQYDLPGVPNHSYRSYGMNMRRVLNLLRWPYLRWDHSFVPANTGMNALKQSDGTYTTNTRDRNLADQVNFGVFPAEYSTGALSKKNHIDEIIVKDLKWKDFRPGLDLSQYRDAVGGKFDVETIPLFDKSLSDIVLRIKKKNVHFVLLHTVPAYHFGNSRSLNAFRNGDQLAFLEWYLTGRKMGKEYNVESLPVKPLPPQTSFVAMGDWNVDLFKSNHPGVAPLKRLKDQFQLWMDEPQVTQEGRMEQPEYQIMSGQLDYILLSQDIHKVDSGVYHPDPKRIELGCYSDIPKTPQGMALIKWEAGNCAAFVAKDYYQLKKASDHLPLWVEVEFEK